MTFIEIGAAAAALFIWLRKHLKLKASGSLSITLSTEKDEHGQIEKK